MTEHTTKERILEGAENLILEKSFHSVGIKHYSAAANAHNWQLLLSADLDSNPHNRLLTHLHDLSIDSDFGNTNYFQMKPLDPVLEEVLEDLKWSEHLVLSSPMWWGGLPAKLKGLFDRAFLPGRVFDTRVMKAGMPSPLLMKRSARVILTSDTPGWFMHLVYKNTLFLQIKKQILGFVGIKPARIRHFSGASQASVNVVDRWIERVRKIGAAGA